MTQKPITHHFLEANERPGDWVAIRFKRHKSWLELNWQDYYRRAEAVALGLAARGISQCDRVAILSNTRWEWAALDFGILGLGAVTVPIYQSNRADEIEWVLMNSEARILFVEDLTQLRKWESLGKKGKSIEHVVCLQPLSEEQKGVISWDEFVNVGLKAYAGKPQFFATQIKKTKLEDLATIVYTSGTTGDPKGVMLNHQQIISEVEDLVRAYPISNLDSTLSFLPYAHVLGRVELWLHTYLGFTLSFAEGIERLKANLREVKPSVIIGVPRIFEKIYSDVITEVQGHSLRKQIFTWLEDGKPTRFSPWLKGPKHLVLDRLLYAKLREGLGGNLRFTVSGGAPLESRIGEFFHRAGILILEGYGLTETTAAITVNTPSSFQFGTVGKPLADVDIKLAADGEILVKSQKVMHGYYHEEAATQQVFADGYFCTGDIGEWTGEGFLRITDRKKDLIKTAGGKYVAPQKLEGLLRLHPEISHVLIHGDRKKYVVALITLNESLIKRLAREKNWPHREYKNLVHSQEVREQVRKLVAQVNTHLASYETIKNFAILPHDFTIESGELTPSLKVKRRVCDEHYKDILEDLYKG